MMPMPADWREALQWFVNTYGLYSGSTRGLFLSDWTEEQAVSLEAAVINLKTRGFVPLVISGETLYQQAEYIFNESQGKVPFGRPLASKLELELSGNDVVVIDNLESPEKPAHLWYLLYYLLFPRVIAGKVSIFTTQISYEEFIRYGSKCPDFDFCGKPVIWEKAVWLFESCTINKELFKLAREESLPPMLKAEYSLYTALRERGLEVVPQHVLGDYLLDFAMVDQEKRLNIECDILSPLAGQAINSRDAKRDYSLLSDGWQILKFSTSEMLNNQSACADVVEDAWRGGRKRSQCGRLFSGKSMPEFPQVSEDEVQQSAIIFGGGPLALVGGAGTGKTLCVVQRVAYLVAQGINPENILALSYSPETARILKQGMEKLIEKQLALRLNVLSWHDLGMKILRENLTAVKRKPPLKIEPSPQKVVQKLIAKVRKEVDAVKLEMAGELDEFYVSAMISMYKSHLIGPAKAREDAQGDADEIIAKLYQSYEDQLLKANRIDKDDVSCLAAQVLLDNPELRSKYQSAYEFVLIDEYQDVSVAQDMLARVLAAPQDNLFVAGDEDEAISEGRNACPELLSEFSFRYPNARTIIMEHNWRCHPNIIEHARWILAYLERRKIAKDFMSAWGAAPSAAIFGPQPCIDESEEVAWVTQQVKALIEAGRNASDIAILYKQNQYNALLEAELLTGGIRFLASQSDNSLIPDEVGDMLAFLKLVMDPDGPRAREAFERVCQLGTKEIDPKLSATIASFAGANNLSYLKAVEIYAEATADSSCRELEQLVRIIRAMNQDRLPPFESIGYLRRTRRLNDYYKSIKIPPGQAYEPLRKLGQLEEEARKFSSVAELVQHVEERMGEDDDKSDIQAIHVKSVMDIKGYEYPIVFLLGLADGFTPSSNTQDLEEERRQFYVAFTRAREAIYLTYPVRSAGKDLGPSRFLLEARLMQSTEMPVAPPLRMIVAAATEVVAPAIEPFAPSAVAAIVQVPARQAPAQQTPVQPAPLQQVPAQQAPVQQAPVQQSPVQQSPVQQAPSQQAPAQRTAPSMNPISASAQLMPAQQALPPQPAPPPQAFAQSPQIEAPVQPTGISKTTQQAAQAEAASPSLPGPPGSVEPIVPHANPSFPAKSGDFSGFGMSKEEQADLAYAEYQASQTRAHVPMHEEASEGDPYYGGRREKVSGLSPYVADEPAPQRNLGNLPPAKGAASPPAPAHPTAAHGEANAEPAFYENALPIGLTDQAPAASYSGVPPLPPPLPKSALNKRSSSSGMGPPVHSQSTAQSAAGLPANRGSAQSAASPANQAGPVAPAAPPSGLPPQQYPPVMRPPAAPALPTVPASSAYGTAPQSEQSKPPGHEYKAAVDIAALHALRGNNAYLDPALLHGHQQAPMPEPAGGLPVCPSCGNGLEVNARFCGECGYSLPERIAACIGCAAPLEPGAKFCGECGTPVVVQAAPVAEAAPEGARDKGKTWMIKFLKFLEK